MQKDKSSVVRSSVALAALVLVTAVYWPGLKGPFMFDDQVNILRNPGVRMQELSVETVVEAALSTYGVRPIHRPIPRITFALNYYYSGKTYDSRNFKITNVVFHVFNAALVFWLTTVLLRCLRERGDDLGASASEPEVWAWFPLLVAVIWMLHPIQLTSVLYVVQRMTSMAGSAVLLGLLLFVYGRRRCAKERPFGFTMMVGGVAGATILGILCKETAVLTPLFAGLIEWFFFRRDELPARVASRFKLLYGSVMVIMLLAVIAICVISLHVILNIYDIRNFGPLDRLMTQPRVLLFYLGLLAFPNVRSFGLFHDDIAVSTGLLSPWTTVVALLVVVAMLVAALRGIGRKNLVSFAVLWYFVGHSVESSVIGLELIHEHRNYIPSIGPIFAACFAVFWAVAKNRQRARLVIPVLALFIGVQSFVTHTRAAAWDSRDGITFFAVRNHPESYRAQMGNGAALQMRGVDVFDSYAAYRKAADLNRFNIMPLARMQRIVSGVINQFKEGTLKEEIVDQKPSAPSLYADDLIFDLEHMRAIDALLLEEISHRLRVYALDAETAIALDEMRRCIGSQFSTCPPESRVDAWMDIALGREQLQGSQKVSLLLGKARLASYRGELNLAVELMEQALGLTASDISILIEIAMLFGKHDDLDSADELLEKIAPLVEASGRRATDFRRLKEYLAEERAGARSQDAALGFHAIQTSVAP